MVRVATVIVMAACLLVMSRPAEAYIGPGAGITALGTVVAFIGAVVFAIIGFIWYPIKRLLGRSKTTGKVDARKATSS